MAPDYSKGAVTPRSRLFIHAAYRELDHAFLGIARRLVRLARDEALVLYALPLDQALLGGGYALVLHLLDLGLRHGLARAEELELLLHRVGRLLVGQLVLEVGGKDLWRIGDVLLLGVLLKPGRHLGGLHRLQVRGDDHWMHGQGDVRGLPHEVRHPEEMLLHGRREDHAPRGKGHGVDLGLLDLVALGEEATDEAEGRGEHVDEHVLDRRPDRIGEIELGILEGARDGYVEHDVAIGVLDEGDDQAEGKPKARLDLIVETLGLGHFQLAHHDLIGGGELVVLHLHGEFVLEVALPDEPGDGLVRVGSHRGKVEVADLAGEIEIERRSYLTDVAPYLEAAVFADRAGEHQLRLLVTVVAEPGHEQVHLREVLGERGIGAAVDEAERALFEVYLADLDVHGLEEPLGLGGRGGRRRSRGGGRGGGRRRRRSSRSWCGG